MSKWYEIETDNISIDRKQKEVNFLTHSDDDGNVYGTITFGQVIEINKWVIEELMTQCAFRQAKIDELMLEYCPDEMTQEQIKEWEEHQADTKMAS